MRGRCRRRCLGTRSSLSHAAAVAVAAAAATVVAVAVAVAADATVIDLI